MSKEDKLHMISLWKWLLINKNKINLVVILKIILINIIKNNHNSIINKITTIKEEYIHKDLIKLINIIIILVIIIIHNTLTIHNNIDKNNITHSTKILIKWIKITLKYLKITKNSIKILILII